MLKHLGHVLILGEFPVFHKGYTEFLSKMSRDKHSNFFIGVLGNKLIKKLTALEPDIRKVSLRDIEKIMNSYLKPKKYFIVEEYNFSDILKKIKPGKIIILKGDKSEDFAEKYLENYKDIIQYFDIRLRWQDSKVQEFKKDVSKIPQKELVKYRKFMAEAEKEAEKIKMLVAASRSSGGKRWKNHFSWVQQNASK